MLNPSHLRLSFLALLLGVLPERAVAFLPARPHDDFLPGLVAVRARPGVPGNVFKSLIRSRGLSPHRASLDPRCGTALVAAELAKLGITLVNVPRSQERANATDLARRSEVQFATTVDRCFVQATPNDPSFSTQTFHAQIRTPGAWNYTTGSPSELIAVVDSGIDPNPDLAGKLRTGINLVSTDGSQSTNTSDATGHGTGVAGALGAFGNNRLGGCGVARDCPLLPIRVVREDGGADAATIAAGLTWAVDHGARLINLSLAPVLQNPIVGQAAQYVANHGGLVVVASGNAGVAMNGTGYSGMLGVASVSDNGTLSSFSSYGSLVPICAPGEQIYTTNRDGQMGYGTGTSYAAPLVTGVAALVWSINPQLTANQVVNILEQTARPVTYPVPSNQYGYGIVDAQAAVIRAYSTLAAPAPAQAPTVSISSPADRSIVSGTTSVNVASSGSNAASYVTVNINSSSGTNVYSSSDYSQPFSFSWNTRAISDGVYTIAATAQNQGGGQATARASVTVDNTPPSCSISAPAQYSFISGATPVNVQANDSVKVAKVVAFVDGVARGSLTSPPWNFTWQTTGWSYGWHQLGMQAVDGAGNTSPLVQQWVFINN